MNKVQLTNELAEELLPVIKKYGTPAVKFLLGLYGFYIINNLAERAIDNGSAFSAGFFGLTVNINNAPLIEC